MIVNKKILLLWTLCLIVIALAVTLRLGDKSSKTNEIGNSEPSADLYTDQSFYTVEETEKVLQAGNTTKKDEVSARSYIVANLESGKVYLEKNSREKLPVASMSKLVTAIAVIDKYSLEATTTIDQSEIGPTDTVDFKSGEIFTLQELLSFMLLNSSNTAAEALASSSNRQNFMATVSSYAWEIGMPSTYFDDPSGISPYNISSASDFLTLAKYLYKFRADILKITTSKSFTLSSTTEHNSHDVWSTHPFTSYPNFLGGKTGHTKQAKDTMLSIFLINNEPIAIVVLASDNRKKDTLLLYKKVEQFLQKSL